MSHPGALYYMQAFGVIHKVEKTYDQVYEIRNSANEYFIEKCTSSEGTVFFGLHYVNYSLKSNVKSLYGQISFTLDICQVEIYRWTCVYNISIIGRIPVNEQNNAHTHTHTQSN